MRESLLPVLAVILLVPLAGCQFFPDPPPGWEGDFSALAALDRAIAASGPATDSTFEARDFRASLSITRHDLTPASKMSYVVLWKAPGYWSIEKAGGGGPRLKYLFDGRETVSIEDGKVVAQGVPPSEIGIDRFLRYLFLLHFFRHGRGDAPEIDDTVRRPDGGFSLRIAKVDEMDREWILSLDAETLKPVALREFVELPDGRSAWVDTYFENFSRDGRGFDIPRVMRSYVGGQLLQEMKIGNLSWNRGLREIDFEIP